MIVTYDFENKSNSVLFVAPIQNFSLHFDKNNKIQPVYSLDVTSNGLGVSSSSDGSLLIWLTSTGEIRVIKIKIFCFDSCNS
jgi:hypothetical protein